MAWKCKLVAEALGSGYFIILNKKDNFNNDEQLLGKSLEEWDCILKYNYVAVVWVYVMILLNLIKKSLKEIASSVAVLIVMQD